MGLTTVFQSINIFLKRRQFLCYFFTNQFWCPSPLRICINIQVLLQISLILRPENSSVSVASRVNYLSERCLAYLLKISTRDCLSGKEKVTDRSIRLNIAGSRSIFLLVAQISSTLVLDSKLSIFLKRVERILLLA